MININIPNRPFATDVITGLMMPDGIFEASLGKQRLNAQFQSAGAENNLSFYVESVSHPGIVVTPSTYTASLTAGATRVLSWDIDVSAAPPGEHQVSFIAARGGDTRRVIKKIFVTRVSFDPATSTFSALTPEGRIEVRFRDFVKPRKSGCCGGRDKNRHDDVPSLGDDDPGQQRDLFKDLGSLFRGHDRDFELCLPGYLPTEFDIVITPTPAFAGQFGDLPFQDPWWKVLLWIIVAVLLIAAAIVEAFSGTGSVSLTVGGTTGPAGTTCCSVGATGGGTSYVAGGLLGSGGGRGHRRDTQRHDRSNPPRPGEHESGSR
ncbi:MAG: hypothetical protein ACXW5U_06235 [Thermoanaerobaculia bacterium]